MKDKDLKESMLKKTCRRQEGKEYFDERHQIHKIPLGVRDIVLRHNTFTADVNKSTSTKFR